MMRDGVGGGGPKQLEDRSLARIPGVGRPERQPDRRGDAYLGIVAAGLVASSAILWFASGVSVSSPCFLIWFLVGGLAFLGAVVAVPVAAAVTLIGLALIRPKGRRLLIRLAMLVVLAGALVRYTWLTVPLRAFDLGLRTRISRVVDLHTLRTSALQLLRAEPDDRFRSVQMAELPEPIRRLHSDAAWVKKKGDDGYVFIFWGSGWGKWGLMITPRSSGNRYLEVWPDGMSSYVTAE